MKKLFMQAVRFVGLSGIGWILDFITYTVLGLISANLVLNNSVSSWVGVTFVFVFATSKVFKNNSKISLKWKYIIYILYQVLLIFFISKVLVIVNGIIVTYAQCELLLRFSSTMAKIIVTPITMTLNFLVMKGVIEKL